MTNDFSQAVGTTELLAVLSVLGRADTAGLAALLGLEDSAELAQVLPANHLATLAEHPAVQEQDGWLTMAPETASTILDDLEQDDLPRYRQLHERAVAYLAGRLRAGDQTAESAFIASFERLANRLLLDDQESLSQLVDSVREIPLSTVANRCLRRYFEGLVLGLNDRYTEALAVFDEVLAEPELDDYIRGRTLNSRALFCITLGRLEEALAGHQACLDLWRQLGNRLREGLALLNLGILAYELRRYDQAESNLAEAARCFEEIEAPEQLASVQNERGLVYRDLGRWEEALACFEAAAAQWKHKPEYLGLAQNNIGEVLLFQGRLEEAAAAFQAALAALRANTYAVDAHLHLGLVYQAAGNLPEAHAAFQKALELALAIGRQDILAEVHYRLGELLRRLGQDTAALTQFEAGVAVIEANREPLRDEGLKISLLGRWQQVYEALMLHYLALDRPVEAFAVAERARARAFADAVTSSATRNSYAETQNSPLEAQSSTQVVTVTEVQAGLPEDAALLCYFTTGVLDQDLPLLRKLSTDNPVREHLLMPARTLLFVLTRHTLTVYECPLDPNAFTSDSPRRDDRSRFLSPTALRRLYSLLLAPVGEALAAKRLYIVPHGPLHHVPFGALLDQGGQSLVHTNGPHLAYAPSATVLLRHCLATGAYAGSPQLCLAVGYDGGQEGRALRHTEAEATFVAGLTGGQAWVGSQPKGKRLRQVASEQRWLHFACHGQFNYEAPLDSYLETGAGERLTASEVLQNWRLEAELVILSACQTGISHILRGDEPMGLIRAFLLAGAKTVLVSQWSIEDLPTFLLMQRFYDELQKMEDTNPAAALQVAQVWLRGLTTRQVQQLLAALPGTGSPTSEADVLANLTPDDRPFAHPRYWAAFVLVGKM